MLSNAFWRQRVDPVVLANMDRALHRLVKSLGEHGQGEEGCNLGLSTTERLGPPLPTCVAVSNQKSFEAIYQTPITPGNICLLTPEPLLPAVGLLQGST